MEVNFVVRCYTLWSLVSIMYLGHCIDTFNLDASIIPGEFIVVSKGRNGVLSAQEFLPKTAQISSSVSHIGDIETVLVRGSTEEVMSLQSLPGIITVEPNRLWQLTEDTFCQEQMTESTLWGLTRISKRDMVDNPCPGCTFDYSNKATGAGVNVYVVDTGVKLDHEEFEGRAKWGFTAPEIEEEGNDDLNGHGTHVAATVAGVTYGVAKEANIIAVKVLNATGSGTTIDILQGIEFIMQDADNETEDTVCNFSLGLYVAFSDPLAFEIALEEVIKAGIHVVVASGNYPWDACQFSPARVQTAITVGASSIKDTQATFSNWGPCVDLLAPGEYILSASIDSMNASVYNSGTSMAAPHVAGAVAGILSYRSLSSNSTRGLTPGEMKDLLLSHTTKEALDLAVGLLPPQASTSPNKLLYIPCEDLDVPATFTTEDPATFTSEEPSFDTACVSFPVNLYLIIIILVLCAC